MSSLFQADLGCSCCARRWGWVVTLATFGIGFVTAGFLYTFGIISVALQKEFNSGVTETGWIPTIAACCAYICVIFLEALIAKCGHRLTGAAGIFLNFTGCMMSSFMPTLWPMYITFGFIYGTGSAFSFFAGLYLIMEYFPTKHCSRATVLAFGGTNSGMLALSPLVHYLVASVGWRNTLRIMGTAILILGLLCIMAFRKPDKRPTTKKDTTSEEVKIPAESFPLTSDNISKKCLEHSLHEDISDQSDTQTSCKSMTSDHKKTQEGVSRHKLRILLFPDYIIFLIATALSQMSLTFFFFYWVQYMLILGFADVTAALAMTVIGATELLGKLLLAATADHLPFPKIYVMDIAICIGIAVMVSLLYIETTAAMFCISAVSGMLVMSVLDSMPLSVCNQTFGPVAGTTPKTIMVVAASLGQLLGTVLGLSVDKTGSFLYGIYGCMAAYVVSSILYIAVPLYQRTFAKTRYVMCDGLRKKDARSENLDDNQTKLNYEVEERT